MNFEMYRPRFTQEKFEEEWGNLVELDLTW